VAFRDELCILGYMRRLHGICRSLRGVVAATIISVGVAACRHPMPPAAASHAAPPPQLREEEIRVLLKPQIAIVDLTETPSADKKTMTVSGALVNRGTGATREVYVHVDVLDRNGAVLATA